MGRIFLFEEKILLNSEKADSRFSLYVSKSEGNIPVKEYDNLYHIRRSGNSTQYYRRITNLCTKNYFVFWYLSLLKLWL